jgi:hypothetical protein
MPDPKLRGLRAVELIGELLRLHPEVQSLSLFEPEAVPLAQARLAGDDVSNRIVCQGLGIREAYGAPFWDAVLLSCFGRGGAALPVLKQAQFHNSGPRRDLRVQAVHWGPPQWTQLLSEVAPGRMLVFSSRVSIHGGESRHIPLLDFHCPATPKNEELAALAAELLDIGGGFLLESGESYHFYGNALLDDAGLVDFLGRALLLAPIIDRAWIAHQLIERACGLRISQKHGGGEPLVVRGI